MDTLWFVLFIIFIIAEVATSVALVSIWFCVGALAALFTARMGGSFSLQLAVFIVVTAISLAASRPLVKKITKNKQRTNADRMIGMKGLVIENIDNAAASGAVKIDGKEWTARTPEGEVILAGQQVKVLAIQGVKLIVTATV